MMRRLIDASIPVCCLVAVIPTTVKLVRIPASLTASVGELVGQLWASTLMIALLLVVAGICIRTIRPAMAYLLEVPALFYAGCVSSIYGTAIWFFFGLNGWAAAWFVYSIGANCLFRFLELYRARHAVKAADPVPAAEAAQ